MKIQFNKGLLELCILSALERKDYYGYELLKTITKRIKIPEASFYPLLNRLTKEGYIETYVIDSADGDSRKYFKITTLGENANDTLRHQWDDLTSRINILIKEDVSDE